MNDLDYGELKIKYDTVCMNSQEFLDLTVTFLHSFSRWIQSQPMPVKEIATTEFHDDLVKLVDYIEKTYHPAEEE